MKRIIAAILVLFLLFGGTPSVSANSAQTYWEGVDSTGVIITDGESPIVVEHELLTFDLQEFPDYHRYAEDYPNKVTAQYTFHNPSDMTVTAKLFFPFGDKNWYYDPDNTLAEQYRCAWYLLIVHLQIVLAEAVAEVFDAPIVLKDAGSFADLLQGPVPFGELVVQFHVALRAEPHPQAVCLGFLAIRPVVDLMPLQVLFPVTVETACACVND